MFSSRGLGLIGLTISFFWNFGDVMGRTGIFYSGQT